MSRLLLGRQALHSGIGTKKQAGHKTGLFKKNRMLIVIKRHVLFAMSERLQIQEAATSINQP